MASGSFSVSTNNSHIVGQINWSESQQNSSADTSVVYAEMRLWRNNTGYTSYGTDNFWVSINGTTINSGNESYSLTYNSNTLMVSGSVTVTHNADGTKSITIGWGGGGGSGGVFTVNGGSGTATLDTLPRASTISSGVSWTAGTQNLGVTLNVASSSFHHTLTLEVQDTSNAWHIAATRTNIGSSTTMVFTQTEITNMYTWNNAYEWRPATLYVDTYDSSGNHIGSQQSASGYMYAVATATATIGTGNTWAIGTNPTYSINNYQSGSSGGFTYDLVFSMGSFSKTFTDLTAQTGTLTFTSTDVTNMYNATPNSNTLSGTVRCRMKYNEVYTEDGASSNGSGEDSTNVTATVTVSGNTPMFSASPTYQDGNSTVVGITGSNQYIVQNQSDLQVMLNCSQMAMGQNGATISSYTCTVNGVTVQQANNAPLTKPALALATNAGSTLPANTTYYVVYTWTLNGNETFMSPENSITVPSGATDNITITVASFPTGVTAANIYVSNSSNTETYQGQVTSSGGTFTLSSPLVSGRMMPMMMFDMGKVNSGTANTITTTAIDSRGNSTSVTSTFNIVPYAPPSITTTSTRASGFDVAVTTTCSGTYSRCTIGGTDKNTIVSAQYQFKKTTASSYPTTGAGAPTSFSGLAPSSGTLPQMTASPNDGTGVGGLDNTAAFNIMVIVVDNFGNTATYLANNTTYNIGNTVITNTVTAGIPILFVDTSSNKSVGIGAFPSYANVLQLGSVSTTANPTNLVIGNWSNASAGAAQIIGGWQGSNFWGIGTKSNSSSDLVVKVGGSGSNGVWNSNKVALETSGGLRLFGQEYVDQVNATMPATAGWYRIAQAKTSGIGNVMGEFEITCASSGYHTQVSLLVGSQYAQGNVLNVLGCSSYSSASLSTARLVYPTNGYTGNYVYLEVYLVPTNTPTIQVRLKDFGWSSSYQWQLISPVSGSVPTNYAEFDQVLDSGGRLMLNVQSGANANGTYVRYSDGLQVCWQTVMNLSTSGLWNSGTAFPNVSGDYYQYLVRGWTFPAAFNATPSSFTAGDFGGVFVETHNVYAVNSSSATMEHGVLWSGGVDTTTQPSLTYQVFAIGTWR